MARPQAIIAIAAGPREKARWEELLPTITVIDDGAAAGIQGTATARGLHVEETDGTDANAEGTAAVFALGCDPAPCSCDARRRLVHGYAVWVAP